MHTKNAVPPAALFQHERAQRLRHAYAFCVVSLRRELSVPSLCSPDGSVGCDYARHSWRTWSELGQKKQASLRNCRQAASACGGWDEGRIIMCWLRAQGGQRLHLSNVVLVHGIECTEIGGDAQGAVGQGRVR